MGCEATFYMKHLEKHQVKPKLEEALAGIQRAQEELVSLASLTPQGGPEDIPLHVSIPFAVREIVDTIIENAEMAFRLQVILESIDREDTCLIWE
jgi:hypothetical protein